MQMQLRATCTYHEQPQPPQMSGTNAPPTDRVLLCFMMLLLPLHDGKDPLTSHQMSHLHTVRACCQPSISVRAHARVATARMIACTLRCKQRPSEAVAVRRADMRRGGGGEGASCVRTRLRAFAHKCTQRCSYIALSRLPLLKGQLDH